MSELESEWRKEDQAGMVLVAIAIIPFLVIYVITPVLLIISWLFDWRPAWIFG